MGQDDLARTQAIRAVAMQRANNKPHIVKLFGKYWSTEFNDQGIGGKYGFLGLFELNDPLKDQA